MKKNKNLSETITDINALADTFEKINEMISKGISFEIMSEETTEDANAKINEEIEQQEELGFLQNDEDIDDLDFDEMNDIWDEMDEE